jgi:hypothetical protein
MAGMNLGMSERNDTMAAHRSVVAVRKFEFGPKENKIKRGRHSSMRREGTDPTPADGRAGVIAAATHALSPFVESEAGVGTAFYAAKSTLHGQRKRRVRNAGGECSSTE